MKIKLYTMIAAVAFAAMSPAVSMALADLAGVSGNGRVVEDERTVNAFDTVVATGSEEVRIHRGSDYRVIVACDENLQEYYRARVSGGRLELGFEPGVNVRHFSRVTVDVWTPDLEGITLSGSGDVTAEDAFGSKKLDLILSGSGSIEGLFEGGSAEAVISGSGSIDISGSSERLSVVISGSGDFNARDFAVGTAQVSIAGSGSVDLGACDDLSVSISGSGNVSYKGTPRTNVNVSGSGNVHRR